MQREDGVEPVVILMTFLRSWILPDVNSSSGCSPNEQVLITAAVGEDIPAELRDIATFHDVRAVHVTEEGRAAAHFCD